MGSKLDQVPSSIFFHEDPYSSICVILLKTYGQTNASEINPSLAEVQVPIFIDQAPTFFGHGGSYPPHFKISRINTADDFTVWCILIRTNLVFTEFLFSGLVSIFTYGHNTITDK